MQSRAFAVRDQVWMQLATSPDGSTPPKECFFDTIEVAEDFALALMKACEAARSYGEASDQKPLF